MKNPLKLRDSFDLPLTVVRRGESYYDLGTSYGSETPGTLRRYGVRMFKNWHIGFRIMRSK
jgi:hypothetical protein